MADNKSNDWIMWIVGGIIALLGYGWITSQKAGAGGNTDEIPLETSNLAKSGGCGCHR